MYYKVIIGSKNIISPEEPRHCVCMRGDELLNIAPQHVYAVVGADRAGLGSASAHNVIDSGDRSVRIDTDNVDIDVTSIIAGGFGVLDAEYEVTVAYALDFAHCAVYRRRLRENYIDAAHQASAELNDRMFCLARLRPATDIISSPSVGGSALSRCARVNPGRFYVHRTYTGWNITSGAALIFIGKQYILANDGLHVGVHVSLEDALEDFDTRPEV